MYNCYHKQLNTSLKKVEATHVCDDFFFFKRLCVFYIRVYTHNGIQQILNVLAPNISYSTGHYT